MIKKTNRQQGRGFTFVLSFSKSFLVSSKVFGKKVKTWNRSKVEDKNNSSPRPIMAQNAKNIKNVSFVVKPLCELFHDLYEDD